MASNRTKGQQRLQTDLQTAHGRLGLDHNWPLPICVTKTTVENRPGYSGKNASEYLDEPAVLQAKIELLAETIRNSQRMCVYTGAGISTAAGVRDYATKAGNSSVVAVKQGTGGALDALPTAAHYGLAELHRAGYLHRWIQQNHDGLPQKAGVPQTAINEIHGSWFDPSNPVVKMSGSLRQDLIDDLEVWEQTSDLVIAMGTSLAGMMADCVVESACDRHAAGAGFGGVIIGIQQTRMDDQASLRIFGKLDDVVALLLKELKLVPPKPKQYVPLVPAAQLKEHVFKVPYHQTTGLRLPEGTPPTLLNLRPGAKVELTTGNPDAGTTAVMPGVAGVVSGVSAQGHYRIVLDCKKNTQTLGLWWLQEAVAGTLEALPLVNTPRSRIDPKTTKPAPRPLVESNKPTTGGKQ